MPKRSAGVVEYRVFQHSITPILQLPSPRTFYQDSGQRHMSAIFLLLANSRTATSSCINRGRNTIRLVASTGCRFINPFYQATTIPVHRFPLRPVVRSPWSRSLLSAFQRFSFQHLSFSPSLSPTLDQKNPGRRLLTLNHFGLGRTSGLTPRTQPVRNHQQLVSRNEETS